MSGFAWVTLATNDSYSLGALVLAHSLRRANTAHQLAILITPGVTEAMRTQLSAVYNVVKVVDVLDSRDEANLTLLARPELGITFTKLHCWRLTQFSKCVFLDADTLVLQNCDELFEREELSAAPDAGWPDCFNSGVFVFKPSNDTFKKLIDFAVVHGSFDGGDQGLLNLYFKDWATKDITKHLPFVYNMCSTATYSYLPAFKQFGENLKIIHFIGSSKPWLQVFDTETGLARVSGESQSIGSFVQLWWDLFCNHVHPSLSTEMTRHRLSSCYVYSSSTSTTTHYPDPSFSPPPKSNPRIRSPPPSHVDSVDYYDNEPYVFIDPWDELLTENSISNYFPQQNYDTYSNYTESYNENNQIDDRSDSTYTQNDNHTHDHNSNSNYFNNNHDSNPQTIQHPPHPKPDVDNWHGNSSNDSNVSGGGSYELWNRPTKRDSFLQPERRISMPSIAEAPPSQNQHACTSFTAPTPQPTPSALGRSIRQEEIEETHPQCELDPDPDAGLAAALATLTIGSPLSTEQTALQEHLRRQGWEQGNIDYMGRDSFDNIWLKISETLNITESADETPQIEETPSASVTDSPVPSKPTVSKPLAPLEMPSSEVPKLPTPPATSVAAATSPPPSTPPVTVAVALTSPATSPVATPIPTPITPPVFTSTTPPIAIPITPPVAAPSTPTVAPPTTHPVAKPTTPVLTPTSPPGATPTAPPVAAPTTPPVAAPTTPPVAAPTTPPVAAPPVAAPTTPPVAAPTTPPVVTPTTPPVATPTTPPVVTPTLPVATPIASPAIAPQVVPEPTKSKPVPAAQPESPPVIPAKAATPLSPPTTKPTQPSPLTPPISPKTEVLSTKSAQPSTPTVTSPTPPTSPPVDPFESALSTKLKVDPETPDTPPVGAHSTGSGEPPVPPKRKGGKAAQAQEQTSKAQPKGGKSVKGKK